MGCFCRIKNACLSMGVFCCLFVEYLSIVQGGIFMMSGKSTGREWSMLGDRVFVYLKDEGTGMAFLRQAEAEGFSFGDGANAEG